ncbi:MAG: RnfABCDGE type electron transport complex subunit D [Spirochaetota bacterium]
MKIVSAFLNKIRPLFEKGGRFYRLWPVFQALDNFLFLAPGINKKAPFGRDPLDVKRFMSMVILALLPSFVASIYFFGWRVLLMLLVSYAAGGIVEVLFAVIRKEEINEGFLVTGFIFPLILPPGLPLWMVAVGVAFGVFIGKEIFGGTGRNIFNPALVGRCFLSFGYPATMASGWIKPAQGGWGGITAPVLLKIPDAATSATPLILIKSGPSPSLMDLFLGKTAGSAGETSALAILLGGVLLLIIGIANWRTVAATVISFLALSGILHAIAPAAVNEPLYNLLSGGILFGAFFMATDPVTSPITQAGKWVYGILIGSVTVLIRGFAGYVEGVTFAILFGNICAPLIDEVVIRLRIRRYARER